MPTPVEAAPVASAAPPELAPEADDTLDADGQRAERVVPLSPVEIRLRIVNMIAVIVPLAGLAVAILVSWGRAFDWVQFGIFAGMVYFTSIGITVGYHRLFTHRSFKTNAVMRFLLGALGSMAVQGAVIEWCGAHRRHHQHSDDVEDPHSPHVHAGGSWGSGIRATFRGFYHAHVGWLFGQRLKGMGKYTPDLRADPVTRAVNTYFYWIALSGLVIPALLGGLITWTWMGALLGFLWGGLVRILFVHHITWSVNSVCHLWGTTPFRTGDHSRNNPIVGVLAHGEGWHNNHHAFPTSARHGLAWWQFDPSYMLIRALALVGLVWDVRTPDRDRIAAKLRRDEKAAAHEAEEAAEVARAASPE
jgi:stearoyl-CoA desaturase (delta-9 desaturase)